MESAGQMEGRMQGWAMLWTERTTTIIDLLGIFEPNKSAPAIFNKIQQFAPFLQCYNCSNAVITLNHQKHLTFKKRQKTLQHFIMNTDIFDCVVSLFFFLVQTSKYIKTLY